MLTVYIGAPAPYPAQDVSFWVCQRNLVIVVGSSDPRSIGKIIRNVIGHRWIVNKQPFQIIFVSTVKIFPSDQQLIGF